MQIVAGIDVVDNIQNDYPVFTDIDKCDVAADVVIDFSSAKAIDKLIAFCEKNNLPVVLCSTGLSEEQVEKVPVVMISHGYNGSWEHGLPYAERFLEAGFAAALFDFCGGAEVSRSEGAMTEMSVRALSSRMLTLLVTQSALLSATRIFLMLNLNSAAPKSLTLFQQILLLLRLLRRVYKLVLKMQVS